MSDSIPARLPAIDDLAQRARTVTAEMVAPIAHGRRGNFTAA